MQTVPELPKHPDFKLTTRTEVEHREHQVLSAGAACADTSLGRLHPSTDDLYRTAFQRDRDKILHCKSFRRLSHKTQVFVAPEGDHYRTRLTHTLEVSQIARTIARALSLNEDLTESIALGHDLGHTPFGHTGEDALSECLAEYMGLDPKAGENTKLYRHNHQSVRVVDVLENEGQGLNLSREVVDGIYCHTGKQRAATYEGRIVAVADRIAYTNHDIDDAIRAGLLVEKALPKSTHSVLGKSSSERITCLVQDLIETSQKSGDILLSQTVWDALLELRAYLFKYVYLASDAKVEEPKAFNVVKSLFTYYIEHLDEVPQEYRRNSDDDPSTQVVDYVSGMTDRYAIRLFQELSIPKSWRMSLGRS